MVDNFSIALSHVLLAVMLWRLFNSPALDADASVEEEYLTTPKKTMKDDQRGA